jgi:hypothetical protein
MRFSTVPAGSIRAADPDAFAATVARHGRFAPRPPMERDLVQADHSVPRAPRRRALSHAPYPGGADERLHDRFSIGVGAISPGDVDVDGGLRREWAEELDAGFVPDFRFVGLLNDDTTEVGSVHLGAVYIADAGGRPVSVRELDKLSGGFAEPADVAAVVDRMETWAASCSRSSTGVTTVVRWRRADRADRGAIIGVEVPGGPSPSPVPVRGSALAGAFGLLFSPPDCARRAGGDRPARHGIVDNVRPAISRTASPGRARRCGRRRDPSEHAGRRPRGDQ